MLRKQAHAWLKNSIEHHAREAIANAHRCANVKYSGDMKRAAAALSMAHSRVAAVWHEELRKIGEANDGQV